MGGFFAAALKSDCVFDVYFGTDYHSHLGTRRAGMVIYDKDSGFDRSIHNIENAPFRTKFEKEIHSLEGQMGLGCISDYEPQPLIVRSHHGTYAITTVGRINNVEQLIDKVINRPGGQFLEMSGGDINATELVASLINQQDNIIDGIKYAQDSIDGSMTILLLTAQGIYCARDKMGRTPLVIGKKEEGYCAAFETFSYLNLEYQDYYELGPGEIVIINPDGMTKLADPGNNMKICAFLWVYYGYPSSRYEGVFVEQMRHACGAMMADRDSISKDDVDIVAGVPDSGVAHAIGYSNKSGIPYSRPFIKYTPTWPRSFMPTVQTKRDLIAKMKLIPVNEFIDGKKILLIDDSIVRGTQLRDRTGFLFESGAKEVHARPACPPIMFGCKYLNFSRSTSEMELITRVMITRNEGEVDRTILEDYANPDTDRYRKMLDMMCKEMGFTSLEFNRIDDMLNAIKIDSSKLCTYCWNGKE